MSHVHRYSARLTWSGSTAVGYDRYERSHTVATPPADTELRLSSDPAFLGDPSLMNPEQMVVAAASSCQLLSFLAAAARSRIVVLGYTDEAEGEMDEGDPPARIGRIVLRPRIVVADGTEEARVQRLVELAHEQCFVANALGNTEMSIEPTIEVRS